MSDLGWIREELNNIKERKVQKKILPVKKEFTYNPRGSFSRFDPYDVAFCYPHPLYEKPFIVKGGHQLVRDFLKKMNTPMIVHHTFYMKGMTRTIYGFYGLDKGLQIQKHYTYSDTLRKYRISQKFELVKFTYGESIPKKVLARFKRVPRRWIRELNLYVPERRSFHGNISGS